MTTAPPSKPSSTKTVNAPLAPPPSSATLTSPKISPLSSPTITPNSVTMPSAHNLHPVATFTSSISSVSSTSSKLSSSSHLFSPSNSPNPHHFPQMNACITFNHHISTFPASKLSLGSPRLPPPPPLPSAICSLSNQGSIKRPHSSSPTFSRKHIKSQVLQRTIIPFLTITSSPLSLLPTPPPSAPSSDTEQQNVPW